MNSADPIGPELLAEIEAYYDGELSDDAAEHLRKRLVDDSELANKVAEWEAVYRQVLRPSAVDMRQWADLRAKFDAIGATMPAPEAKVRKLQPRVWWGAAAGAMLLLIAGWWAFGRPADPAVQLAEQKFAWLPRQELLLGPNEDAQSGLLAYDRGEFATAYPLIMEGIANGRLDSVNLLYAGVAALGDGQAGEARSVLRELLETGRYPLDEEDLRYYLALAEIQEGQRDAAERWLTDGDSSSDRNALLLNSIRALPEKE